MKVITVYKEKFTNGRNKSETRVCIIIKSKQYVHFMHYTKFEDKKMEFSETAYKLRSHLN